MIFLTIITLSRLGIVKSTTNLSLCAQSFLALQNANFIVETLSYAAEDTFQRPRQQKIVHETDAPPRPRTPRSQYFCPILLSRGVGKICASYHRFKWPRSMNGASSINTSTTIGACSRAHPAAPVATMKELILRAGPTRSADRRAAQDR